MRGVGPREGRAEQSSGAEVAADGTCRAADRASRRKLERFETSVVTVDSFGFLPGRVPSRRQPACDESSMGLCHLVKSGTLMTSSGRPLRRSDRKVRTARRRSKARPPPQRGRSNGRELEDHGSRICPRAASEQKVENAVSHVAFDGVTTAERGMRSAAGPSPARQGSTLGLCSNRQLRFECLDHGGRSADVGSRSKVSQAVKAELEPSRVARWQRP